MPVNVKRPKIVQDILGRVEALGDDPYQFLRDWKARNDRKIIACLPMHFPLEMIHATGMLPVEMWPSNERITIAHSYVHVFYCGLSRSIVDDALQGKLEFLDGMYFYDQCMQARGLPFVIERNTPIPNIEFHHLPPIISNPDVVKPHLKWNLEKIRKSLERISGKALSDDAISQSIKIYNKNRKLLQRLYRTRKKNPGLLRAREIARIVQASALMLKEEHNELLEQLLPELEKLPVVPDNRVKIFIVGHFCHPPRFDVMDMIEDEGMVVVDDDIYNGARYFALSVNEDVNPIDGLADKFLDRSLPCPTRIDNEVNWGQYVKDKFHACGAQGVINLLAKYCPPHQERYVDIKRELARNNIPELLIELEHEAVSLEGLKTRLQALREQIEMGVK